MRPPATSSGVTVRDLLAVHRLEFPFWVNTACQAVWGACFAVTGAGELVAPATLAALAANFLIMVAGLLLNTAVDLDSDRRHPDRGRLVDSAQRWSGPAWLRLAAAEFAAGLLLAVAVSAWTGRWLVAGAAAGAIVGHLLYNVDPVRLKARGFPGAVVFGCAVIAMPCLLSAAAVRPGPPPAALLAFAGLTVLAIGRVVWWSVPDLDADAAAGLRTTSVRHGAVRALVTACLVLGAGLVLLGAGLWWHAGALAAALGTVAHLLFLGAVLVLLRRVAAGARAGSRRLQKTTMPLVMVADLLVVGVALMG